MAIKVNGTTVINDSRVLSGVTGLKTVGGTAILGSGNITTGASTAVNGVGTYMLGYDTGMPDGGTGNNTTFKVYKEGRTVAGSALRPRTASGWITRASAQPQVSATSTSGTNVSANTYAMPGSYVIGMPITSNQTYSGSWRLMSPGGNTSNQLSAGWGSHFTNLWVRYA